MLFWNSLAFSMIQWMLTIWSVVPPPFLNPAYTSGNSQFIYCWSLAWRLLSITLLECEMKAIVWKFEHSLALPLFGIGMKTEFLSQEDHVEKGMVTYSSILVWRIPRTEEPSGYSPGHQKQLDTTELVRVNQWYNTK